MEAQEREYSFDMPMNEAQMVMQIMLRKKERFNRCECDALLQAVRGLSYRVPKTPTWWNDYDSGWHGYICPTCAEDLPEDEPGFCVNCGQMLTWDDRRDE